MTLADVTAVAKKYIHPGKYAVLVVGNGPEIKPPLDELKLGPAQPIDITIPMPKPPAKNKIACCPRSPSAAAEDLGNHNLNGSSHMRSEIELNARRVAAADRLMAQGVTIHRPETCVIDAGVEVAPETVIEPFVQLLGRTRIGSECLIRSYSVIENCALGNRVLIRQSCVLADSTIADDAKIGPFAHLRPGCEIGEEAHVGNFVEIKKAKLGKGVKASHLTYLGDAEIGEGTNIGAGVITCNYDGVNKHRTRIGKGVFVGSDSTLVAPVTVEDGAFIGAGSCITRDVPAGSLAVAGLARLPGKVGPPPGAPGIKKPDQA